MGAAVAAGLLLALAPAAAQERAEKPRPLEGWYAVEGVATERLRVERTGEMTYRIESRGQWEGAGILDGEVYFGVFRYVGRPGAPGASALAGATGTHVATRAPDGSLVVRGQFTRGPVDTFDVRWVPAEEPAGDEARGAGPPPTGPMRPRSPDRRPPAGPPPPPPAGGPGDLPAFGEYVPVDELPVAVKTVGPVYPEDARKAGVQGTVMVQALLGVDGLVLDARVTHSIPMLDAAAVAAVRQWRFKPAMAGGKPVATWVAVPVKFTLH
jgi:protein TonB